MSPAEAANRFAFHLSRATPIERAAAWLDGFLHGSGQILVYDDTLFSLVDDWLASLPEDAFTQLLPLASKNDVDLHRTGATGDRAAGGARRASTAFAGGRAEAQRSAGTASDLAGLQVARLAGGLMSTRRHVSNSAEDSRLRRWRLVLGGKEADGTGVALRDDDAQRDAALSALYDSPTSDPTQPGHNQQRRGGLGGSAPRVVRWLGDIRRLFPASIVTVMQRDALDRLGIERMLLEPEMLAAVRPDVHLVTTLMALRSVVPTRSKEVARRVVRQVVEELLQRIEQPARQAIAGSLDRSARTRRPPCLRHRLEPNDLAQPRALPTNAQDDRARTARGLRPSPPIDTGDHPLRRSEREHGFVHGLRKPVRLRAGVHSGGTDRAARLRHLGGET